MIRTHFPCWPDFFILSPVPANFDPPMATRPSRFCYFIRARHDPFPRDSPRSSPHVDVGRPDDCRAGRPDAARFRRQPDGGPTGRGATGGERVRGGDFQRSVHCQHRVGDRRVRPGCPGARCQPPPRGGRGAAAWLGDQPGRFSGDGFVAAGRATLAGPSPRTARGPGSGPALSGAHRLVDAARTGLAMPQAVLRGVVLPSPAHADYAGRGRAQRFLELGINLRTPGCPPARAGRRR